MRLTLASKSGSDSFNRGLSTERLINLYPVPAPEGAMGQFELRSVPGLAMHCNLPGPFVRGLRRMNEYLYVVTKGAVYVVRDSGNFARVAELPDDERTGLSSNRDALTITTQGDYLILKDGELTQPGSGRITAEGSVTFLDQYTIIGERDGRQIEWTEAGLPDQRNGLYFASAEATDDPVVRVLTVGGYLVVMKTGSTEIWGSTAAGGFQAFARVPGGVTNIGLKGFNLVCSAGDQAFFVGNDSVAYVSGGGAPAPVSTPYVAQALQRNTPTHCFYYEDRGHRFCVIRFEDRPAWVYDITMGVWHERAWGEAHGPWPVIASEYCYGKWHLAAQDGRVYRLGELPVDDGRPMRRTVVSREIYMDGQPFTVAELEILGRFAHSLTESGPDVLLGQDDLAIRAQDGAPLLSQAQRRMDTERPSRVWMRVSRDGGHSFGLAKHRDVAKKGQNSARCRWVALGQARRFCVEINLGDPVEMPLQSEANIVVVQ